LTILFSEPRQNVNKWRAVIFDLDDTLYLERDFVLSGFTAVAAWAEARFGVPAAHTGSELCRLAEHDQGGNVFDRWLAGRGLAAEHVPDMVRIYREHHPHIQPFAAVPELLRCVKQEAALALLTDGYLDVQKRKLAALGLACWFDAVVFSDSWGRSFWKPHSRPYEETLTALGVPGCDAVYVADNPAKDFIGARRVRMASIRVRFGGMHDAAVPDTAEHEPDHQVDNLADLETLLLVRPDAIVSSAGGPHFRLTSPTITKEKS
jgi:putative hydrolase of the HAD superfamily